MLLLDNRLEDPLGRGDAPSDLGEFRDAVLSQGPHPVREELQLGARDEDVHGEVDTDVDPFFLAADRWTDKYVSAHAGNGSEAEWLELEPSPVVARWELVGDEMIQLRLQVQGNARNFGRSYMSTECVDYRLPLVAFDGEAGVLGLECLQSDACLVNFSLSILQHYLSHLVLLNFGVQKMVGQQLCLVDIPRRQQDLYAIGPMNLVGMVPELELDQPDASHRDETDPYLFVALLQEAFGPEDPLPLGNLVMREQVEARETGRWFHGPVSHREQQDGEDERIIARPAADKLGANRVGGYQRLSRQDRGGYVVHVR